VFYPIRIHYRLASKVNPADEPGAFPAREWLRKLVVGKQVQFETRKQGAGAGGGDRVYGLLFIKAPEGGERMSLSIECVRLGHATPKAVKHAAGKEGKEDEKDEAAEGESYEGQLSKAYEEAKAEGRGIHSTATLPLVRTLKSVGEDFAALQLVESCRNTKVTCVVEYVFDGSRVRCQITDDSGNIPTMYQYTSFTLLLAGILSPRIGNPKADPPIPQEEFSVEARQFVTTRLLQRELPVSFVGTDKSGVNVVGTVYHPAGNIAAELLKAGLARMTDWSVRMMPAGEVPPLRVAENTAKRTHTGIWHSYAPAVLTSASSMQGTVVEVQSGDTLLILPSGKVYSSDDVLFKVSLASIRAPRVGSERAGRPDEPYSVECKDRLRVLTVGKDVTVTVHYERDIPLQPGVEEKRPFGTVSVGGSKPHPDVAEVLVSEGLAVTQRHRDDDEKSPRYDELLAAEAQAKAAKKGVHKLADGGKGAKEYKPPQVNDLTDPRKAKAYSGSLMRAGKLRGIVEFIFNGGLFKIYIPSENCHIRFSPNYIRCPQPSPSPGSKQQSRPAEPFGDEAKRHARLHVLQRQVEITCTSVTNGGIIVGSMFVGAGKQRRDYTIELIGAGLATVDQRKIDYGEAPKYLIDAQAAAQQNKVGVWSVAQPESTQSAKKTSTSNEKNTESTAVIRLSEIRSGNHFFYQLANNEASKVMEDSMKLFTQNNGTSGAPCDVKVGKVVAALFDDGNGKSWYRAKIVERKGPSKVGILFIDHGNLATVPVATHLRPLDASLGVERIPAVATEATLAFTITRPLDTDEGLDAARMFQSLSWGKDLHARMFGPDDSGKIAVALSLPDSADDDETINSQLVSDGLARVAKPAVVNAFASKMSGDNSNVLKLAADLNVAQEAARKTRSGMWRYGDVGDDDPDEL